MPVAYGSLVRDRPAAGFSRNGLRSLFLAMPVGLVLWTVLLGLAF